MNKNDLITEAVKRSGLKRRDAARGVEATLQLIKLELTASNGIHIRGLGRLQISPKRHGFLPALGGDGSPLPIPAGKAVKLKATRGAVASINAEPLKLNNKINFGGNMDKKHDKEHDDSQSTHAEGSALGLDVGTSRLVLASGAADRVK